MEKKFRKREYKTQATKAGLFVRNRLDSMSKSNVWLAEQLGVTRAFLNLWERGRSSMSIEHLDMMCRILGFNKSEIREFRDSLEVSSTDTLRMHLADNKYSDVIVRCAKMFAERLPYINEQQSEKIMDILKGGIQ